MGTWTGFRAGLSGMMLLVGSCGGDAGGGGAPDGGPGRDAGPDGAGDATCFAAPSPVITLPDDGARFEEGEEVTFHGLVSNRGEPGDTWMAAWRSDLEGELCSGPPGAGASTCVADDLGVGLHHVTLEVTDDCGITETATISIVVNGPPVTPAVLITPATPTTADNLLAAPANPPEDPNGDPVTLRWAWLKNGIKVDALAGPNVSSTLTDRGEVWTVRMTATDGTRDGETRTAEVTITNSLPAVEAVQILPSSGGVQTAFTCVPTGWSDPDGTPETFLFRWTVNGGIDADQTGAALTATLHKGDVLRCAATPVDDEGEGATVESEPVTVINTPPSCDAALLTPMTGDVTTVFSCTPEACADADGDPFTTQVIWTLNGEDLPPSTTDEISPVEIGAVRGDTLRCKVFGGDGTADGSPVKSAEVILGNALPQIASAVAGPIPVHEEEVVTCTPSGWEDADGDPAGFVFQWTVNAVVVEGQTSATLSGEFFDKGDVVSCTAIPFDGLDQGAGVDSKVAVTVADTAPAITGVSVTPGTGSKANTFTCEALGWSDPDPADQPDQWAVPDPMDATLPGFVYAWKVNGQVVPDALSQAWQPHSATKGDTLSCAALPHDGELAGEAKTSPGVLLLNAPPTVASVAISPAQGGKNDTFQCVPSGYQDPDVGDPEIYQFQWYVDGVLLAGQELATLSGTAAGLAQGDLLVCSVIPFDGEGWGAPVTSAPREITNSLPSITGVTIQPGTPVSADDLACVPAGWLDTDGDPPGYLFQWSLNQALLGSQTTSTLSHTLTKKGDKVMCVVTPFDGMDQGFTKSSPLVTIGNTPPPPPEVHVSPAFPELGDDLSCVPSGTPADPDGDSVTLAFSWFLDAAPLPGETGATLDGAVAGSCDVVRCEAVASDGSAASAPGWDDVMVDGTPGLGIHSLEQALTVPDSGSLQLTTGKLTVELWVMPMPGATGPLVTKHDPASGFAAGGFELFLDAQGRPGFLVDGGAGAGSAAVADFPLAEGVFTHVAGTYDGASVRLFVQGVLVDAAAATGGISCDEALVVGLDPLTGEATDVIVDEIRINQSPMYATNFTPSTVLSVGPDTRLLLHLDEDGGSTVQDASSWNNDGSCALCHWTLGACAVQAENLPPSKPTVQIVPGTPADGDDLVCNVTVESVDPEGLPVTYGYAWTSTGGDQVSGKVAAAALTAPGEIWTCTVTPFDGALYGPAGTAQVTITGGTINPAGSYALSPPINYKCAFFLVSYLVNLNYSTFNFLMNGNSLSVQPMMNGGCTMTGTYNPVNKTFSASCVYTGTCNETYNLIGTFAANNSWSGTWTVGFSGQCFDCTFQSRSLTGTKL